MSETAGRNRLDATIPVRFADAREFLVEYSSNISMGGVFVRTSSPAAFGSVVRLSLELPGSGQAVPVTGQVAFVLPPDEAARQGKVPGMGVRFSRLDPVVKETLASYVAGLQKKSKGRVLLVDDDPLILQQLSDALRKYNLNVVTASNAIKALEIIRFGGIDFIISDIQMPRMDGFEFRDNLRGSEKTANIPFVFLTSSENEQDRGVARELGVETFLVKPFNEAQIVTMLRQVLGDDALNPDAAPPAEPQIPKEPTKEVARPTLEVPRPASEAPADLPAPIPAAEQERLRQRKAAELAYQKFVALGLDTRVSPDEKAVFGQLVLRGTAIQDPATGQRLERAGFYSVGHDRAKPFWPRALGALPLIRIAAMTDGATLERALTTSYTARMEQVRGSKEFLDRLRVENRYDPNTLRVYGRLMLDRDEVVFTLRNPRTAFLETLNKRSFGALVPMAARIVDVSAVRTAAELQSAIGKACAPLSKAPAQPAAAAPAPVAANAAPAAEPELLLAEPPVEAAAPAEAAAETTGELVLETAPGATPEPEPAAAPATGTETETAVPSEPLPEPSTTFETVAATESASAPEGEPVSAPPPEPLPEPSATFETVAASAPGSDAEEAPAWSPEAAPVPEAEAAPAPEAAPVPEMDTYSGLSPETLGPETMPADGAAAPSEQQDAWTAVAPATAPEEAADWGEATATAPPAEEAPAEAPVVVGRAPGSVSDFLAALDGGATPIAAAPAIAPATPQPVAAPGAAARPAAAPTRPTTLAQPADDAARKWADEWSGDEASAQALWTVHDDEIASGPKTAAAAAAAAAAPAVTAAAPGGNSTVLVCNHCGQYYSVGESVDDERLLLMCPACIAKGG